MKVLDKTRDSVSIKVVDAETDETLKELTVQLKDGEGCSENITIPEEWEAKTIKAIEA